MSPVAWGPVGLQVGVTALVVAAGSGSRMGPVGDPLLGGTPKQFLPLAGVPVLLHTLRLFEAEPRVDDVVVVAPPDAVDRCTDLIAGAALTKVVHVVPGGTERADSVRLGLARCGSRPRIIAVHDAVRPLLPPDVLSDLLDAAGSYPALALGTPARDTIKEVDMAAAAWGGQPLPAVVQTPARERLWHVQTPQVFWAEVIATAYRRWTDEGGGSVTDCATLVERTGAVVHLFPGVAENIKLTTPGDFVLAEAILSRRAATGGVPS